MNAISNEKLQRLREAAHRAGFIVLTTEWQGSTGNYVMQCDRGHQITRTGSHISRFAPVCEQCRDQNRLALLHEIAQSKGGRCLETTYLGYVHHRFVCAEGHEWKINPTEIINQGSWCRRCAQIKLAKKNTRKDGLQALQRIAVERGGKCLSDTYAGASKHHRFECAKGHQWEAAAAHALAGSWCRACEAKTKGARLLAAGRLRLQTVLSSHSGICLDEYVSSQDIYRFRCYMGHEWAARATDVACGRWCQECARQEVRNTQSEILRQIAKDRGGLLLSDFVNSTTKVFFECHSGHRWHAFAYNVRSGSWCRQCADIAQIRNPKSKAHIKYQVFAGHQIDRH